MKEYEIKINDEVKDKVFLDGAKSEDVVLLRLMGWGVLSVIGVGANVEDTREEVYKNIDGVEFVGMYLEMI